MDMTFLTTIMIWLCSGGNFQINFDLFRYNSYNNHYNGCSLEHNNKSIIAILRYVLQMIRNLLQWIEADYNIVLLWYNSI
jgi:hypothetical protein